MEYAYWRALNGECIGVSKITEIEDKVLATILSELPKEVQTYDAVKHILTASLEKLEGTRIFIENGDRCLETGVTQESVKYRK